MARANPRKKCPAGKIINQATGRCVSKKGKIGMGLKSKTSRTRSPRRSPSKKTKGCPVGKIVNPATGRCVSKKGKIGMGLMGKKPKTSRPRTSKPRTSKSEEKPSETPRAEDTKPQEESYEEEFNKWYKYYYDMLRNAGCQNLDAMELVERDNIDESNEPNTAIRRPALSKAAMYLKRICENEKKEEVFDEPACEVDNYNPDDLSCKKTSALYLHPDKNPSCPKKATAKFDKWRKRCNQ